MMPLYILRGMYNFTAKGSISTIAMTGFGNSLISDHFTIVMGKLESLKGKQYLAPWKKTISLLCKN